MRGERGRARFDDRTYPPRQHIRAVAEAGVGGQWIDVEEAQSTTCAARDLRSGQIGEIEEVTPDRLAMVDRVIRKLGLTVDGVNLDRRGQVAHNVRCRLPHVRVRRALSTQAGGWRMSDDEQFGRCRFDARDGAGED